MILDQTENQSTLVSIQFQPSQKTAGHSRAFYRMRIGISALASVVHQRSQIQQTRMRKFAQKNAE